MDNISRLPSEDSAAERLVGEGKSDYSLKDQKVEIKYLTDSQNGDTKIDMENLKSVFVGMGKEELMKYANDPFWVKMRWFLFLLFWVLWFAMLSGAIAIIVLAPKCAAPTPREWYELSPIYKVKAREPLSGQKEFSNLEEVEKHIEYLKDLGVSTILVDSLMTTTNGNPDLVEDYKSVDPALGSVSSLKKLTTILKEQGIHLLMSFVPNFSSDKHDWFLKSIEKEEPYKDYFVWAPSKGTTLEGQHIPPNNWLSVTGGSAWEWNEKRNEFYLHQFDKSQPDLNFRAEGLVNYFKDVFKFWLDLGISGFHLEKLAYLLEDKSLKNETVDDVIGAIHDQYVFYTHRQTRNHPDTIKLVREWTEFIQNNSGIVSVSGLKQEGIGQLYWEPLEVSPVLDAEALNEIVLKRLNKSSIVWEWICKEKQFCLDETFGRGLQLSLLLLPGTTVIKAGEELKSDGAEVQQATNVTLDQIDDPESSFNIYRSLIEARSSPSVMYGSTETAVLNGTVFSYSRIKSGNPGYLVAFNLGEEETVVNLQNLKLVPQEVTVVTHTPELKDLQLKSKISSSSISIPSKTTLVVTFVPESK